MLSLYRPLTDLFRDDFMEREFGSFFAPTRGTQQQGFYPAVDVLDNETAYLLKVELPGVPAEDIQLEVKNGVLTLSGERKHETEKEEGGYRRVERRYGHFSRSFTLPEGTNVDAIEAHSDQGVLTVSIPKVVKEAPRQVQVKVGSTPKEIPTTREENVA